MHKTVPSRSKLWAGLLILASFVLSGCYKVDTSIVLHDNETIDMSMTVAVNKDKLVEVEQQLGGLGGGDFLGIGGDKPLSEMSDGELRKGLSDSCAQDLPEGVKVEEKPYSEGAWVGVSCSLKGITLEQVRAKGAAGVLGADAKLEHTSSGWTVALPLNSMDESLGALDKSDPMFPMVAKMLESFEISMRITASGKVVETNATSVNEGTAEWKIDITDPPSSLTARWDATKHGSGLWLAFAAGALVALIASAAALVVLKRGKRTTEEPVEQSENQNQTPSEPDAG